MKLAFLLSILALVSLALVSWAEIPKTMSYQGKLTDADGDPVVDGDYELTFSIYDVAESGTALWTELHSPVAVVNGIFNVILGSGTPLDIAFDEQYWLGIAVAPNPELTPRVQLTSAAYSLNARSVPDGSITSPKIAGGMW